MDLTKPLLILQNNNRKQPLFGLPAGFQPEKPMGVVFKSYIKVAPSQ